MRLFLIRSLLIAAGFCLPAGLVEMGLRTVGPFLPGNYETGVWAQGDPIVGHVHTPDSEAWIKEPEFTTHLRFNHLGLRGGDLPPRSDAQRVLALGDSFIEAKQVSEGETITSLLSRATTQADDRPVEWMNGGVFDWGPTHELLFLRETGPALAPDLVLQFFYIGNDLGDCFPRSRSELRDLGRPLAMADDDGALQFLPWTPYEPSGGQALLGSLSRHSSTFRAFETGVVDKIRYQPRSKHPIEGQLLRIFQAKESGAEKRAWETVDALLAATRDESTRQGARFALVIIPGKWQVHPEDWSAVLEERDEPEDDRWSLGRPNKNLTRLASAQGIPVLDLLPIMRADAERGQRLYFQRDVHWNARGHAVAAAAVSEFVEEAGLRHATPGREANAGGAVPFQRRPADARPTP